MVCHAILLATLLPGVVRAQTALTWEQVKAKFEAANPTLKANQANIDESKAEEITAFLRPNPEVSLAADGTQITPIDGLWQPIKGTTITPGISYLHERQHKRELRLDTQKETTAVTQSTYTDQERGLIFSLPKRVRSTLWSQRRCWITPGKNLAYWDRELDRESHALGCGDLAQFSFDHRAAAGAIRVGLRDRIGEPADQQDPAADVAERSHAH